MVFFLYSRASRVADWVAAFFPYLLAFRRGWVVVHRVAVFLLFFSRFSSLPGRCACTRATFPGPFRVSAPALFPPFFASTRCLSQDDGGGGVFSGDVSRFRVSGGLAGAESFPPCRFQVLSFRCSIHMRVFFFFYGLVLAIPRGSNRFLSFLTLDWPSDMRIWRKPLRARFPRILPPLPDLLPPLI